MLCPKCGKRPISFLKWAFRVNCFRRIECVHCRTPLRAGYAAYLLAAFMVLIAMGLVTLQAWVDGLGMLKSPWGDTAFHLGAIALIFFAGAVIPWIAAIRYYRTPE
jgi:hypothetical protein